MAKNTKKTHRKQIRGGRRHHTEVSVPVALVSVSVPPEPVAPPKGPIVAMDYVLKNYPGYNPQDYKE